MVGLSHLIKWDSFSSMTRQVWPWVCHLFIQSPTSQTYASNCIGIKSRILRGWWEQDYRLRVFHFEMFVKVTIRLIVRIGQEESIRILLNDYQKREP